MVKRPLCVLVMGLSGLALSAQDATRGEALYRQQCATCHGERLEGRSAPSLAGSDFRSRWRASDLLDKIRNTMPQDNPGKLTAGQAADLAAYIQQVSQTAGSSAPVTASVPAPSPAFPATGNLSQLMRGIMFPNSNIIFTVQTHDPAEKK